MINRLNKDNEIDESSDNPNLPYYGMTELIIGCCFNVMKELGVGFIETVYKNALFIELKECGLAAIREQPLDVYFKGQQIGIYKADIIVENSVIIELKCCKCLMQEHKAQVINYLKATNISVGLLINFGNQKLEYKRLHKPVINCFKLETTNSTL